MVQLEKFSALLIFRRLYLLFYLKLLELVKSSSDGKYLRKSHFNFGDKFEFSYIITTVPGRLVNHDEIVNAEGNHLELSVAGQNQVVGIVKGFFNCFTTTNCT